MATKLGAAPGKQSLRSRARCPSRRNTPGVNHLVASSFLLLVGLLGCKGESSSPADAAAPAAASVSAQAMAIFTGRAARAVLFGRSDVFQRELR